MGLNYGGALAEPPLTTISIKSPTICSCGRELSKVNRLNITIVLSIKSMRFVTKSTFCNLTDNSIMKSGRDPPWEDGLVCIVY